MATGLDLAQAVRWLEWLLVWSLGVQTWEFLRIHRSGVVDRIWHWPDQKDDVPDHPRWLKAALGHLFQPPVHQAHLWPFWPTWPGKAPKAGTFCFCL